MKIILLIFFIGYINALSNVDTKYVTYNVPTNITFSGLVAGFEILSGTIFNSTIYANDFLIKRCINTTECVLNGINNKICGFSNYTVVVFSNLPDNTFDNTFFVVYKIDNCDSFNYLYRTVLVFAVISGVTFICTSLLYTFLFENTPFKK